ncbi:MAG: monovalent cation/H(+) antiporter subunit G [Maricaulaceae bacterium]
MSAGDVWSLALDAVSYAVILTGVFFVIAGSVGVVRLPDFYTRLHAAGVTDTLGAELVVLGLVIQAGWSILALKLLLVGLLLFLTSPTATHATANAAWVAGLRPMLARWRSVDAGAGKPGEEAKR